MARRLGSVLLSLGLVCVAACQPQAQTPKTNGLPLAGQTVELVIPTDLSLRDHWEPLLQEWHAQTGGDVAWAEYEPGKASWNGERSASEAPNGGRLIVLALPELAAADAAGFLTPLPNAVADEAGIDQKDLFPGLKDAALSRQKRLIAMPVSAPVLLCYYRKDLLDAAGLVPPETWDDYQALLDKLAEWAPGLLALEPCGPEFRAELFLARSAAFAKHPQNYSVWFDIQTGDPLFDSPAFERALDTARLAWSKMPADIWTLSPAECRLALLSGKTALVLAWEPAMSYPPSAKEGETASESTEPLAIGIVPLPGTRSVYQSSAKRWENIPGDAPHQPAFVGFTGLAMGVQAGSDRAAAWNLLQTLSSRSDQAFAERPRSVCRESEVMSAFDSGQLPAEAASLVVDATAQSLRRRDAVCDLTVEAAPQIREILAAELEAAQDASKPTIDILAAMQSRVKEATESDRARLRDSYRRSVGLAPLAK